MDITYQYAKKRGEFGRQPQFCEQGPEMCDSIHTNLPYHKSFILRNPVNQAIQNTPLYSEQRINTVRAEYTTSGANHAEGGWPKDVNIHDPEATQRYRRKIEKDDGYLHCVNHLVPGMEHYVSQNNAVDMYCTYFAEIDPQPSVESISCRTVNVYRDPEVRPANTIAWQPEGNHFAVTYIDMDFNREPRGPLTAYIWDVETASTPDQVITPPSLLFDLQYNPRESKQLIGGLLSGQVAHWDLRSGPNPVETCPPHEAHRDLVRKVLFNNSKSGQEFFSSGPDGVCKWWDIRYFTEPTDVMIMDLVSSANDEQSMANAKGVCSLEFEPTIPTRFMVGTENGLVIGGNRKGKTPLEKLPAKYEAHLGPVWSLERNPFFLKNFLTVGDWTARIWSEDCRESAVLWTPPLRHRVTSGAWSPTRMSLMLLTGEDGRISIWDLVRRQHEPALTQRVCPEPLLCQSFHENGSHVAIGSRNGVIYMEELSHHLVTSDRNDKAQMMAFLERESKRERILEARQREIKLKQRQADESSPVASLTDLDTTDQDIIEATADYMAQIKKELTLLC